ncbi:MAG: hypothetical protein KBT14_00065, partial [Proteobacteria bacterium]|nr:hypothetical protein [Candidatus Enterousia onthequi]
ENKQQNNDIPTDAYITVKRDEKGEVEIYVGGKPTTKYRGQDIWDIPFIKKYFEWMQGQNSDIKEFHIGAFATPGYKEGETGNPSSVFGPNAWCRLKFKNGKYGTWVFNRTYGSAGNYAYLCAGRCALSVRTNAGFRDAVFRAPIVPQGDVLAQLKQKVNEVSNRLKNERAQHTK